MPDDNKKEVLEAEYVGDSTHEPARNYSYGQYNTYSGNGQRAGGARFTVFQFRDNRLDACRGMQLANFITMVLFFTCLFQWGFLAALGFAFFYILAAGAGRQPSRPVRLFGGGPFRRQSGVPVQRGICARGSAGPAGLGRPLSICGGRSADGLSGHR